MRWTLLRKELAEHWAALVLLFVLSGLLFAVISLAGIASGTPAFEVFRRYLQFAVPLAAWFLGGRLVRREYGGSTQLFLDALPIRRSWVLTAKHVLGAIALAVCVAPAFMLCWLAALRGSDVTGTLLAIIALRTFAFVWFVHALCFSLGFLGRYRTALVILAFVAFVLVAAKTDIEASEFGPFALIDQKFPFERSVVPVTLVLSTCAASAVLTGVAYGLAALREGSVAARLAQQMSQREKAFVGLLVVASLFAAFVFDEKRTKKPFAPEVAAEMATPALRVVVGAGSGMTDTDAKRLAATVHRRIDAMREYLRIETLPPIYLFTRHGLDATRYEHGSIEGEEGIVVRVSYPSEGWDDRTFTWWLAERIVEERTNRNARRESRRWLFDGFGGFWTVSEGITTVPDTEAQMWLRALYGAPDGVTRADLDAWDSFRERVGDPVASAVASSGLRVLASRHGADAARGLLADALGTKSPKDVRALFGTGARSVADLIELHARISYDEFLAEWNADLSAARERWRAELDAIPRVASDVSTVAVSAGSREIAYRATLRPAPKDMERVRFEWTTTGPFNTEFDEYKIEADDVAYHDAAQGRRVPHSFRLGERIAWRVSYTPAALGCAVVSPVRRTVFE